MNMPLLHGAMAILLRRESRSPDLDHPEQSADLDAQSIEAADRAGYEGMSDGWAYLAGFMNADGELI